MHQRSKTSPIVTTVLTPRIDEKVEAKVKAFSATEGLMWIGREGVNCIGKDEIVAYFGNVKPNPLDSALGEGYLETWQERVGRNNYASVHFESGGVKMEGNSVKIFPGETITEATFPTFLEAYRKVCDDLRNLVV